jgi:organic radical activating enzyme
MKKIIKIINTQEQNVLDIRFWPTDICNYDCSYCFPNSKDGIYRYPKNINTVINNFRLLFDFYRDKFNKTEFRLNLVGGGEPTMWPYISEFCDGIKKNHNVRLQLTTNGSRTLRWWEENYHFLDKVVLSTHNEFCDTDHIIKVADFLHSKDLIVNSLVLMDANNWDKCVSIVDHMLANSEHPWVVEVKTVVDSPGHDIISYTEEQLKYVQSSLKRIPDSDWILKRIHILNPFKSIAMFDDGSVKAYKPDEYISNKENGFFGWKCDVAKENLVISYDGSVSGSCQESVFKNANINMFSESFIEEFNKSSVELDSLICPRILCGCTPDTHISKSRNEKIN